jgi:type II secretory ATPase GspE/PulE/Tfp pilus assembly ATPase PilB-like protein
MRVSETLHRVCLEDFQPLPDDESQYSLAFIASRQCVVLGYLETSVPPTVLVGTVRPSPETERTIRAYHRRQGFESEFLPVAPGEIELYLSRRHLEKSDFSSYHLPADQYGTGGMARATDRIAGDDGTNPAANLLRNLISEALQRNARDLHLEKLAAGGRARVRSGSEHLRVADLDEQLYGPLVNHIKRRAEMNLLRRDIPQEGSFVHRSSGGETANPGLPDTLPPGRIRQPATSSDGE